MSATKATLLAGTALLAGAAGPTADFNATVDSHQFTPPRRRPPIKMPAADPQIAKRKARRKQQKKARRASRKAKNPK